MSDYSIIKQMRAFARVDGAYLGLIWIISFALIVLQYTDPLMGFLGMFVSVYSLFFVYKRIVKYRNEVCGGIINFSNAYVYSIMQFFYASLILGLAQYIYFRFIDGGFIFGAYSEMVQSDEFREASKIYGMTEGDIDRVLEQMAATRPVDIVMNILSMNIFGSFFLSIFTALFARKNEKIV